jgi:hypothetical protein
MRWREVRGPILFLVILLGAFASYVLWLAYGTHE